MRRYAGSCLVAMFAIHALAGCSKVSEAVDATQRAAEHLLDQTTGSVEELVAEARTAFPTDLAVASPLSYVDADSANALTFRPEASGDPGGRKPRYRVMTGRINEMLVETEDASICRFNPALLIRPSRSARCYGPTVAFENHPDAPTGATGASGQLPFGDTGLWTTLDPDTGEACAAAQLNAGLESAGDIWAGALQSLAALVCAAHTNDITLASSDAGDLVDEMDGLGMPGVEFIEAAVTGIRGGAYSYRMTYSIPASGGTGRVHVSVEMDHSPGASTQAYSGSIWYAVSGGPGHANCEGGVATRNGTLTYDRNGKSRFVLEARSAEYCGADVDGRSGAVLDPAIKAQPDGTGGWRNMFDIFKAAFVPDSLDGDYVYAWQAGPLDGFTRTFNVHVETVGDRTTADAFFGYGADVASTNGSIAGFICNWAGPGNQHDLQPYVQHQRVEQNADGGFDATVSHLRYAPTNSCDYHGDGSFTFDSDGVGGVDTNATESYINDLLSVTDSNRDGVLDQIAASGFTLP